MTADEQKPHSFFNKLGKFCREIELNISRIKMDYEKMPGTHPKQYYMGMKIIKSEVEDLKKLSDETKEKMCKVHQFGYFVQSVRELLKDQAMDVKAMEEYLASFGYRIPDKDTFSFKSEFHTKLNCGSEVPSEKIGGSSVLSQMEKPIDDNKDPQLSVKDELSPKSVTASLLSEGEARGNMEVATPCQRKRNPAWYSTPSASAMKRVERWLENVEEEASSSFSVTPIVNRKRVDGGKAGFSPCKGVARNGHQGEEDPDIESDAPQKLRLKDFEMEGKTTSSTPDEPPLSSTTKYFLKPSDFPHSNTPEEPALSVISKMANSDAEKSHTPEEPQLSSLGRIVSEAANAHAQDRNTPEEPRLFQTQPPLSCRERDDISGLRHVRRKGFQGQAQSRHLCKTSRPPHSCPVSRRESSK